ncbi:Ankyrin repeat domain protein 11 (Ankyrin repeat-containing cofactor-1)-like protein [Camelus ferus]|nr:Ankyrin repeat domain protein 11 (Ankyrin repeat-containing cofactor-1)-like protein [Camelus ferus]
MQNLALRIEGKGKTVHSSRLKSREQIRKNKKFTRKNGWTALHEASVGGFYQVANELLKGGADVNIRGMYQITPLQDAVMNGHYKVAELLLLNGADPLFRNDNGKCALDEAKDLCMKRLLERYVSKHKRHLTSGWTPLREAASEGCNDTIVELLKANAKVNCGNLDGILPLHDAVANNHLKATEILLQHGANPNQKDKKQKTALDEADDENTKELLKSYGAVETDNRAEANAVVTEQYIDKMLEVKEVMDNVLAKQKAERDDLAKKYRVSMESFKQGVLREQLVNLATRQKSLLTVTKNQKKIREKIHNYKNVTPLSGLSFKKLPSSSEISNEKSRQEFTSLETSVQPQSGSLSPVSLVYGSMQETQLSSEIWHDSQNTNTCLNSKGMRREGFSGNELNSKLISDYTLDRLSKSRHSDGTKKIKLPSQSVTFITQAEYSQKENDLTDMAAKEHASFRPSAVTGALNISETTSVLSHNEPYPSAVLCDQAFSSCDPKRDNRKTASQQPPRRASESLAHREIDVFGSNTGHQMKPYLKKSAVAVPHANDSQSSSSSESSRQHTIKKPLNYSTAPKKKCMQIKDLILLGRINPGNNILEFKTQEATHKASVLLSGKIKVENGQIYQNPVTWLKDVLGRDSYVTWNYAWSKVTYQGKELLKYVSEELPTPPDPNLVPQQRQPCPPDQEIKDCSFGTQKLDATGAQLAM